MKIMTCKYFLLFCFTLAFIRLGNGNETEEQESTKQESKRPANYYVWSSTGNESKDEGDNKDDEWGPERESTEDEGTTEDEEEMQEDQNYIQ